MTSFQIHSELVIHDDKGNPLELIDEINGELPSDQFRILNYYDGNETKYYLVTVEE